MTTIKHSGSFVQPVDPVELRWMGYDTIPQETRTTLMAKTLQIRSSFIAEAHAIWERGRLLHDVSQMLTPEQFVDWAYQEFRISRSNAYETVNVFQCFPDGLGPFARLSATALRELARPTTPSASYERVRALLEAGQQPSIEDVKTLIKDTRHEDEGYRSFEHEEDGPEPIAAGDEGYYDVRKRKTETAGDAIDWQFPVPEEEDDIEPDETNDEYLESLQELLATLEAKYNLLLNVVRRAIERRNSDFDVVELTDNDLAKIAHLI